MTIFAAYNYTKKKLENAGIEDFGFEARQIIKRITGYNNTQIMTNYAEELTGLQQDKLKSIIGQREIRYPLQYIFGEWSFYGRDYYVGTGVLIPRADTETLIEKAIELLKDKDSPEILDLCAGSGCIGITLSLEKENSKVTLVEKYEQAARYLEMNIKRNAADVKFILGDVLEGAGNDGEYDLIVSNPPYIPDDEFDIVSPETEFEPKTALSGGKDGLDFYRAIINNYGKSLKTGGAFAFEVGINEAEKVEKLLAEAGFSNIGKVKDLNEIDRVVFAIKN